MSLESVGKKPLPTDRDDRCIEAKEAEPDNRRVIRAGCGQRRNIGHELGWIGHLPNLSSVVELRNRTVRLDPGSRLEKGLAQLVRQPSDLRLLVRKTRVGGRARWKTCSKGRTVSVCPKTAARRTSPPPRNALSFGQFRSPPAAATGATRAERRGALFSLIDSIPLARPLVQP